MGFYGFYGFFIGNEGDGGIGIDIKSDYSEGGANLRRLFRTDGTVTALCFRSHSRYVSWDWLIKKDDECDSIEQTIDPHRARIIIGALYGFGETGVNNPEDVSNSDWLAARALRKAMGLEMVPLLPNPQTD